MHLLQEKNVVANTLLVNRSALRFLYVVILKQKWFDEEIARPKRRPTLPGILSAEEVTRILDHTHNLKHWTILATFYATALRANELKHLKVSDIDSQRMVLHVRHGKCGIPRGHRAVAGFAGTVARLVSLAPAKRLAVPL